MESVEERVEEMREVFKSGVTKSEKWRRSQLMGLQALLLHEEEAIFEALRKDLGKHPAESFRDEVGLLNKSINFALNGLKDWMNPKSVKLPLAVYPASASILPEPLGVVLLFSSWNLPIALALEPLIGALAAGNAVALKPSELAPASAQFLADTIPRYLDGQAVKVFLGGATIGSPLLEQTWDKILFTGSPRVARIVMAAAAKHLTPVILELGGKCPAIFDYMSGSQFKMAVRRLVAGKWGPCCGQACIAVDYVIVERGFAQILIEEMRSTVSELYGDNCNLSRLINQGNFIRLKGLLKDPAVYSTVIFGGRVDDNIMAIEPTILLDPPLDSAIMIEEIFGPLLPIITVDNIKDSIIFVNDRPKPLVIYVFSNNEPLNQQIVTETSSGSVTFNDTMVQYAVDALPFGGVGGSGFGRYHGKFSFDAFSHEKPILRRQLYFEVAQRYPPWTDLKVKFLRSLYNLDYLSVILIILGLKR